MSLLPILRFPDPRLKKLAARVEQVDDSIRRLARDMAETMYEAPGIGLAATQVDVHQRVIVIDASETRDQLLTLVNPEIILQDGLQICEEGCLSVPGIYDKVERAEHVVVRYLDLKDTNRLSRQWGCCRYACSTRSIIYEGTSLCRASVATETGAHQEQARQAGANHRMKLVFAGTPEFAALACGRSSQRDIR
jgi:peptide deformylase